VDIKGISNTAMKTDDTVDLKLLQACTRQHTHSIFWEKILKCSMTQF